jgi:hypothetical protein
LYGKFTWKIENFSEISKRELRSNVFEVGGMKWYILVYPQGCDVHNHLSLFLCVADYDKLLPGTNLRNPFSMDGKMDVRISPSPLDAESESRLMSRQHSLQSVRLDMRGIDTNATANPFPCPMTRSLPVLTAVSLSIRSPRKPKKKKKVGPTSRSSPSPW